MTRFYNPVNIRARPPFVPSPAERDEPGLRSRYRVIGGKPPPTGNAPSRPLTLNFEP